MVLLEEMVLLESRVIVVTLALLDHLVLQVLLVLQVQWVKLANRETEESLVHKDLLEPQDQLEPEECPDLKVLVVTRVRLEKLVREDKRDTGVSLVCRVCLDLRAKLEIRVLLDLLDLLDQEDHQDQSAPQERMEQMVCQDPSDLLDRVVEVGKLVLLVPPETLGRPVLLDLLVLALTCPPLPDWVRPRRVPTLSGT